MDGWMDEEGFPGTSRDIYNLKMDSIYVQGLVSCNKESQVFQQGSKYVSRQQP